MQSHLQNQFWTVRLLQIGMHLATIHQSEILEQEKQEEKVKQESLASGSFTSLFSMNSIPDKIEPMNSSIAAISQCSVGLESAVGQCSFCMCTRIPALI